MVFFFFFKQKTAYEIGVRLVGSQMCIRDRMNTDNMSILGLTLDYGPYGFMDAYDPNFICNHTDEQGRYSFINQPVIAHWNLRALAMALSGVISTDTLIEKLASFEQHFGGAYHALMRAKLG